MSLDELLSRAKGEDKKAENELFQYLRVRFTAFAKRRVGEGDAEDIAHEACLTVLEKYKTEIFTKGFEAWAYGILKNKIGNYLQRKKKKQLESPIRHSSTYENWNHEPGR